MGTSSNSKKFYYVVVGKDIEERGPFLSAEERDREAINLLRENYSMQIDNDCFWMDVKDNERPTTGTFS